MSKDVDIRLMGDRELMQALSNMEYATQQKYLKAILRDASTKTMVPLLRNAVPVKTGNLRKSMGSVPGKSRRNAVVFVGPRMSHRKTAEGSTEHKGWVANILQNAKDQDRYPEKAKSFRPFTGSAAGMEFYKKVGPIRKKINLH